MSNYPKSAPHFLLFRRLWKPALATGAGGAVTAIWIDEIVILAEEILALISLPIMAGVIYLLDILIFKSRMPRHEDLLGNSKTGKRKQPNATH